jgi:hypothetical protein
VFFLDFYLYRTSQDLGPALIRAESEVGMIRLKVVAKPRTPRFWHALALPLPELGASFLCEPTGTDSRPPPAIPSHYWRGTLAFGLGLAFGVGDSEEPGAAPAASSALYFGALT